MSIRRSQTAASVFTTAYYVLEDETKRVLHVLDELEQELDPMYGIMRKAHGY